MDKIDKISEVILNLKQIVGQSDSQLNVYNSLLDKIDLVLDKLEKEYINI